MQNLAQFKKALQPGTQVHIENHMRPELSRDTVVNIAQSNGVYFDHFGKPAWFEFPKAVRYKNVDSATGTVYTTGHAPMLTITLLTS